VIQMEEQKTTSQPEQEQMQQEPPVAQPEPEKAERKADPADVEKNKTMAILAYFIFFLPLITDAKNSPFAKFHANQALVLLLAWIIGSFVSGFIPIIGWFLIGPLIAIACVIFLILGIVNASNGEMKELPLIGGIHLLDK
jgi:uncharacterized membrane protein